MGAGYHGGFGRTLGSTYRGDSDNGGEKTYSERGIEVPEKVKLLLEQLQCKGDYVTGKEDDYDMADASIMSREAKVEFAKVTIGSNSYLIRGDAQGTFIPESIMVKLKRERGKLDFHSHPHNDDLIPSLTDRSVLKRLRKLTGQQFSTIVTPNGRLSTYNEYGIIETGQVLSKLDSMHKKVLLELFGGNSND